MSVFISYNFVPIINMPILMPLFSSLKFPESFEIDMSPPTIFFTRLFGYSVSLAFIPDFLWWSINTKNDSWVFDNGWIELMYYFEGVLPT